jgi:hypothetical protein
MCCHGWPVRHLDVIGEAGFGYGFNPLDASHSEAQNELARAFGVIFGTARKFRVIMILQVWFPILRRFVSTSRYFIVSSYRNIR